MVDVAEVSLEACDVAEVGLGPHDVAEVSLEACDVSEVRLDGDGARLKGVDCCPSKDGRLRHLKED